jgi:putative AdoMet-dependent methyltransferase
MLNVAKGKIVIGDLMFENEHEKEKLLQNLTKEQIEEIEDEYYSNIDVLKDEFRKYEKTLSVTRIDELVFIVEIS